MGANWCLESDVVANLGFQAGADPMAADVNGMSALHLACVFGCIEAVQLLLAWRGAANKTVDVNAEASTALGTPPRAFSCSRFNYYYLLCVFVDFVCLQGGVGVGVSEGGTSWRPVCSGMLIAFCRPCTVCTVCPFYTPGTLRPLDCAIECEATNAIDIWKLLCEHVNTAIATPF